jgi:hypothetical protein
MRILFVVLTVLVALSGDAFAQGKLEQTEIDAWLVRDAQMSSQFAVAEALGYFKAEGIKVNPRWYISGPAERRRRHAADRAGQEGAGDRSLAQGLREAEDRHAQGRLGDDGHPGHGP